MIQWIINPHGIRTLQFKNMETLLWEDAPVIDLMWDVKAEIEQFAKDLVMIYGGQWDALKEDEKEQWRGDVRKLLSIGYYKRITQ